MTDFEKQDIGDNEIRIISKVTQKPQDTKRAATPRRHRIYRLTTAVAIVVCTAIIIGWRYFKNAQPTEDHPLSDPVVRQETAIPTSLIQEACRPTPSHTLVTDTLIEKTALTLLRPIQATPVLSIGKEALTDSAAVLVVQAADIREDNDGIVGAYVVGGELVSKGASKSGYCAIVNGKISLGVAESTPLFEEAIENGGYFFRQYPLVVSNQLIENKPKGRALRKALAEINGTVLVVLSHERLTFHEFSQALVKLGVSNAIYLVGSTACGFAKDATGKKITFGTETTSSPNINFIVWR